MDNEKKPQKIDGEKSRSLVTVAAAGRILNFNPQVIYRKLSSGAWPGYKIGAAWRIDVEEIKSLGRRGAVRDVERRARTTESGK